LQQAQVQAQQQQQQQQEQARVRVRERALVQAVMGSLTAHERVRCSSEALPDRHWTTSDFLLRVKRRVAYFPVLLCVLWLSARNKGVGSAGGAYLLLCSLACLPAYSLPVSSAQQTAGYLAVKILYRPCMSSTLLYAPVYPRF
jgi:hypothetical protein